MPDSLNTIATDDSMPTTKIGWALYIAGKLRIPVFPLSPNSKVPLFGSQGFKGATLDLDQIRAWWTEYPDANIGVHPGENHVVIDLDVKRGKNGPATLCERLGVELWELKGATFAVETPSGGVHLYYLADKPYSDGVDVLKGIDVRASGGYVAGPGSVIDGKSYTVNNNADLAPVRDDLKPILNMPRERQKNAKKPMFELDQEFALTRALDFLKKRSPAIEGIGGNAHTYATAVQIKDLGVSEEACLQLMLTPIHADGRSWNDCCLPAWDAPELKTVVANGFKYGKDRPGAKGGGAMEAFDAAMGIEAGESQSPAAVASDIRRIYCGGEFFKRGKRRETIIPGWMFAHGITAILSKRGGGKTLVMLDTALRISFDMDWDDDGTPIAKGYRAVYLCGEDDEGLEENIRAWCILHNKPELPAGRFFVTESIVDLMSMEDTKAWAEKILQYTKGERCVIFFDTWGRATSRSSQNRDDEMQTAVANAEALIDALSAPALIAFHPPKHDDSTISGSGVNENVTTGIWKLSKEPHGRKLENIRFKGKGEGNSRLYKIVEVPLVGADGFAERDEHGRERTGAAVKHLGGPLLRSLQRQIKEAVAKLIRDTINENTRKPDAERVGDWTPKVMAGKLGGMPLGIEGSNPLPESARLAKLLVHNFQFPYSLPGEGVRIELHDTGRGRGKGTMKILRLVADHDGKEDMSEWSNSLPADKSV